MKEPRELSLLHRFPLSGFAVLNEAKAGTHKETDMEVCPQVFTARSILR